MIDPFTRLRIHDIERFHTFYEKTNYCWNWQRQFRYRDGVATYGLFSCGKVSGKKLKLKAHRVAYAIANGPFDAKSHVLHTCDNPRCVNPAHLYLGDNAQNVRDRVARGRHRVNAAR